MARSKPVKLITLGAALRPLLGLAILIAFAAVFTIISLRHGSGSGAAMAGLAFAWIATAALLLQTTMTGVTYARQRGLRPLRRWRVRVGEWSNRHEIWTIHGDGPGVVNVSIKMPWRLRVHVWRMPKQQYLDAQVSLVMDDSENVETQDWRLDRNDSDGDQVVPVHAWSIDHEGPWRGQLILEADPHRLIRRLPPVTFSILSSRTVTAEPADP